MAAQLTLVGDPVAPTDAADKHYVDTTAAGLGPPAGSVRYDTVQSLTAPQQAQAQSNIGITSGVPAGSVMVFYSAAAPVGWTQVTTQNDKALRVVSGTGGVSGGANAFSTVMAQTAVGNHSLSLGEAPAGIVSTGSAYNYFYLANSTAAYAPYSTAGWSFSTYPAPNDTVEAMPYINASTPGLSLSYISYCSGTVSLSVTSNNTSGAGHNHPITMQMQYCDVILASKN
jgi:hypothetical protein